MVSCESQLSPALCVALRFVLTWVCMRESWGQMGGGVNGMPWVFRKGGGVWRRRAVHWLPAAKKVLMALLHDWAFVTAIVLPATSARGTALSAQSAHHQSIMNGN